MTTWKNPTPTVDICFLLDQDGKRLKQHTPVETLQTVVIKRKNPPLGFAFPGGFVDEGESCESAARREAKEELGVEIDILDQLGTFSDPARDPRKHIMTTAFVCTLADDEQTFVAGDDATDFRVISVRTSKDAYSTSLVFDHEHIRERLYAWALNSDFRRMLFRKEVLDVVASFDPHPEPDPELVENLRLWVERSFLHRAKQAVSEGRNYFLFDPRWTIWDNTRLNHVKAAMERALALQLGLAKIRVVVEGDFLHIYFA